jgi:hypothetical protein
MLLRQLRTLHQSKTFFEDVVLKKVYAISNATAKVGKKLVIKAGDAMLAE